MIESNGERLCPAGEGRKPTWVSCNCHNVNICILIRAVLVDHAEYSTSIVPVRYMRLSSGFQGQYHSGMCFLRMRADFSTSN